MKKIISTCVLLAASFISSAQDFAKYEDNPKVDQMVITQNMFSLLSEIDVEGKESDPKKQEFINLVQSLKEINMLTTSDGQTGVQLKNEMEQQISAEHLKELMKVKKDGKLITFYSKPGSQKGKVSRLLMFLSSTEKGEKRYIMISIKGDIDLNEIGKMASAFKFPGGEELKNVKYE